MDTPTATRPGTDIPAMLERIDAIVDRHGAVAHRLVPILQEVQAAFRYLPETGLDRIGERIGLSAATVYGVATFYAHFTLSPKGRYVVRVCDGTACHVKGAMDAYHAMREQLGLSGEDHTTDDLLFTVETVSCLGACGLAPVITINDQVHGQVDAATATALITELRERAATGDAP